MKEKHLIGRPPSPNAAERLEAGMLFDDASLGAFDLDNITSPGHEAEAAARPRLTLVRPDDEAMDTVDHGSMIGAPTSESADEQDDPLDSWPWEEDIDADRRYESPCGKEAESIGAASIPLDDDDGALDDLVICNPPAGSAIESRLKDFVREIDDEETEAEDDREPIEAEDQRVIGAGRSDLPTSSLGRPAAAPRRIGSGELVPARLTWRPGDPFAGSESANRRRFRWDVMLTSACITAGCGLACIWLLRTILA